MDKMDKQEPNLIVETPAPETKKSPMEMIKLGFAQIGAKFSGKKATKINIIPEQATVVGQPAPKSKKKFIFIAFFVGLVILLVIVVALIGSRMGGNGNGQTANSSPTPALPVFTPAPNKYASDPSIIKMQSDIQSLEIELGQINVEESNLKPRPYLWDINFK